jgi:hypothetical protein
MCKPCLGGKMAEERQGRKGELQLMIYKLFLIWNLTFKCFLKFMDQDYVTLASRNFCCSKFSGKKFSK